jgi:hypothetical protein
MSREKGLHHLFPASAGMEELLVAALFLRNPI